MQGLAVRQPHLSPLPPRLPRARVLPYTITQTAMERLLQPRAAALGQPSAASAAMLRPHFTLRSAPFVRARARPAIVGVRASAAASDKITSAVSPISDTPAWAALAAHAKRPMPHLKQLLADEKRCESMFVSHDGMLLDYSRQARGRG